MKAELQEYIRCGGLLTSVGSSPVKMVIEQIKSRYILTFSYGYVGKMSVGDPIINGIEIGRFKCF